MTEFYIDVCRFVMLIFMAVKISCVSFNSWQRELGFLQDFFAAGHLFKLREDSFWWQQFTLLIIPLCSPFLITVSEFWSLPKFFSLNLENDLQMSSSSPLVYYVFFCTGVRAWTSSTSSPCVSSCHIFTLLCLRMHPYGIQRNLKMLHMSESSTFPEHYSGLPFIHLQCISFDIFVQEDYHMLSVIFFSQHVLYEKLFSTGLCKRKKKCKTVSLKSSVVPVVHLDLHTVGGTWGLVCCCL